MKLISITVAILLLVVSIAWGLETASSPDDFWPQWRGPSANGASLASNPPIEWSEEKNIRWKIEIPGKGSSSPIVWGNQIFLTTAIPVGAAKPAAAPAAPQEGRRRGPRGIEPDRNHQFVVMSLSRDTGQIQWQKTVRQEIPHEGTHTTGTWASNSVVTDGEHVYAYFGSRGLYCLDMAGNLKWEKDFGQMTKKLAFGEGSSPALHDDKILVLWDHEGPSFLFALDKRTGEEVWKIAREEKTSWSSPLVVEHNGTEQVITNATSRIRSYNLDDGSLIWEGTGMTDNVIPSPIVSNGIAYLTSGFRGSAFLAIDLDRARGDVTDSDAIVWKLGRDAPYAPSPLLYDGTLYFLKTNTGVLSRIDAKTGEPIYPPQRLPGVRTVYSSPVGAAGRVYISDRDGNTLVIRHGSEFELLASNSLEDGIDASLAIVEDEIFIRSLRSLYCIAEAK